MERELGIKLLKRENRRFSLTPAGEHFYQKSLLIMADFERLCKETKNIAQGNAFTLRIGYIKGYGGAEFQRAVAEFTAKYPDVPVDMKNGNHEDLYDLLRTEQVDLALNDQRRAFSDEYVNIVLTAIGCHIEISARNPIANSEFVNADDLRHTPCILVASKEQQENDFVLIHMTGMRQSKEAFIKAVEDGTLNYFSAKHQNIETEIHGDTAALIGQSIVNAAGVSPSQAPIEAILKIDLYGTAVLLEEVGKVIKAGGVGVTISGQSGWRMPALTAEQDKLLATAPTEKLLQLEMLQPQNIIDFKFTPRTYSAVHFSKNKQRDMTYT